VERPSFISSPCERLRAVAEALMPMILAGTDPGKRVPSVKVLLKGRSACDACHTTVGDSNPKRTFSSETAGIGGARTLEPESREHRWEEGMDCFSGAWD